MRIKCIKAFYSFCNLFGSWENIGCFIIAAAGGLLVRSASICSLFMSTRALLPPAYARLSLIMSGIHVTGIISGMGLRQALSLDYMHYNGAARYERMGLTLYLYLCMLPFFIFLYGVMVLTRVLPLTFTEAFSVGIILFGTFIVEFMYQFLQYEQRVHLLVTAQAMGAVCILVLSYIFLFLYCFGHEAILYAQAGSILLLISLLFYRVHTEWMVCAEKSMHYHLSVQRLFEGIPFIPGMLFNWFIISSNRWIIAYYLSSQEVSSYAIADTVNQFFYSVILMPWSIAYLPSYLRLCINNPEAIPLYEAHNKRIMAHSVIGCMVLCCVGYYFMRPCAALILPSLYRDAYRLMLPIALGQVFILGSYFASCYMQLMQKKIFMAFSLCIPALLNCLLSFLCVRQWGSYGCACSCMISCGIYWLISCLYNSFLLRGYTMSQWTEFSSSR